MEKKRIAIDINDVIRDYTGQFIKVYEKYIDDSSNITIEDVTDFNFLNMFSFVNENNISDIQLLNKFKYEDYPFELYGVAEPMTKTLPSLINIWMQNTMRNFDDEIVPEIIFVSPFEYGVSIQSTLHFLSKIGLRAREYYFPVDSMTIWDRCDILITANPNLLNNMPDGKTSFKIETSYNKGAKATYTFKTFENVIFDENNTLVKLIDNE